MQEPVLPPDVPRPLDDELLAWAAGFFDGEGSTMARTDSRRADYYQLEMSVPQADHTGVPAVLVAFQRAMLGIGRIYPQHRDDLYRWSSCGRIGAELALALMWPWLGTVKRAQAASALEVIADQHATGRYRHRAPRYRPTLVPHPTTGTDPSAERLRLAWAAGFLDAEGYFGNARAFERKDGSLGMRTRASASQHGRAHEPAEVLVRLRDTLGGRIERHGDADDFKWVVEGLTGVRRVVDRLEPWLGTVKLMQASAALELASAARVRGTEERCARGHVYDRVYVRADGTVHRICNACDRIRNREKRAELGARPRALHDPSVDPSRTYAT